MMEGLFVVTGTAAPFHLEKIDKTTALPLPAFTTVALDNPASVLLVDGGDLYAAGTFANIGSTASNGLARLNAHSGGVDLSFAPAGGGGFALARAGDSLYVGGQFSNYGGPATDLAKLSIANGAFDTTFDATSIGGTHLGSVTAINALAVTASGNIRVIVGGTFLDLRRLVDQERRQIRSRDHPRPIRLSPHWAAPTNRSVRCR